MYDVLHGVQIPHGRGNFEGETSEPLQSIGTLCGHLCKNGRTDRGANCSHGPKESCQMGSRPDPPWEWAILVDRGAHCKE